MTSTRQTSYSLTGVEEVVEFNMRLEFPVYLATSNFSGSQTFSLNEFSFTKN